MPKKKSSSKTNIDNVSPASASAKDTPAQQPEAAIIASRNEIFYIAGIGASAGGLDAMKLFFSRLPPENGLAFFVIQHFDPNNKSILAEILQKNTSIKVSEIENGIHIQPNHVYIVPSGKYVIILDSVAFLEDYKETALHIKPIDNFFISLAQNQGSHAIGIVLSGTGTDGAAGIKAIKAAGGITLAQDSDSAQFDGMPESAIATGCVDRALPPQEMPGELLKLIKNRVSENFRKTRTIPVKNYQSLKEIINIILTKTGHNFSHYKKNTLARRVEKRMSQNGISSIAKYVSFLQQNPDEVSELFRELSITFTHFFREMENDFVLKEKVFSAIGKNKSPGEIVRIWVPGCASGEEPYSIAMLFTEYMETAQQHLKVQIFATDINENVIHFARAASYPQDRISHISPTRLKRFFHKKNQSFVINDRIREMVIFSIHNIIKDPPFSRMDIISCKNLLIYFDAALQDTLLPLFFYVLRPNGFLLLGKSESIRGFAGLFATIDEKNRIFKREDLSFSPSKTIAMHTENDDEPFFSEDITVTTDEPMSIQEHLAKVLLEEFSPPCVIINEEHTIIHMHGQLERFLSLPRGEPHFNIMKLARKEIRLELMAIIKNSIKQKNPVYSKEICVNCDGVPLTINIVMRPLPEAGTHKQLYLIIFQEQMLPEQNKEKKAFSSPTKRASQRIIELEKELDNTKESLCDLLENLEDSNEKLKQTSKTARDKEEELQSTKEELETTKEELQSMNEELNIINAELQHKIDDLSKANNAINTLLSSTEIGTVFLDRNLCIKQFTPAAGKMMNLIESDIKRPISHLNTFLIREKLIDHIEKVLNTLIPYEKEIKEPDNTWCLVRFLPYQTEHNIVDGIVITLVNITHLKRAQEEVSLLEKLILSINESEDFQSAMKAVLHTVCEVTNWTLGEVWLPDKSNSYLTRSASWLPQEPVLQNFDILSRKHTFERGTGLPGRAWSTKQVEWVRDVTLDKNFVRAETARSHGLKAGLAIPVLAKNVVVAVIVFFMFQACDQDEQFIKLISSVASQLGMTFRRKQAEDELKKSYNLLQAIIEGTTDIIFVKDPELKLIMVNSAVCRYLGKSSQEIVGKTSFDILPWEFAEKITENDLAVLHSGKTQSFKEMIPGKGNASKIFLATKNPYRDGSGNIIGIVGILKDITEIK